MTQQEEQLLVQIIVQCVRAVLETSSDRGVQPRASTLQSIPVFSPARFIDVLPEQARGKQNGRVVYPSNGNRSDVRESLQRFLHTSEPQLSNGDLRKKPALQNGRVTKVYPAPAAEAQERQVITQADILAAHRRGQTAIVTQPGAIITPLARQVAKEKGLELR